MTIAFKEWASVCEALAAGRQTVIVRKGGIHEVGGEFRPEHSQFWLYPTYFHEQQQAGIRPEELHFLERAEARKPPAGVVRIGHRVEVTAVEFHREIDAVLALEPEHILSEATIRQRFAYRNPGLYVLRVTVTAGEEREIPEEPEYAGCKTWVPLKV